MSGTSPEDPLGPDELDSPTQSLAWTAGNFLEEVFDWQRQLSELPKIDGPPPVRDLDVGTSDHQDDTARSEVAATGSSIDVNPAEGDPDDGGSDAAPFSGPDVRMFPLPDAAAWEEFSRRFVWQRNDNCLPWFRIVGLLRGMGAQCAVVERYYVCLDHKSEHAAFYSHIDEARTSYAVRVHFFDTVLAEDNLDKLDDSGVDYLGYVVVRRGTLPLVARAMIRTPDYIEMAADVREPVHFLGQTLTVRGCPFMQQDERFANCAHVAIWSICYTAYRRGMIERKMIADIVNLSGPARTLRPTTSWGLYAEQVADNLVELGYRPILLTRGWPDSTFGLPNLERTELSPALYERLASLLGEDELAANANDVAGYIANRVINYLDLDAEQSGDGDGDGDESDQRPNEMRALETLRDHLLEPYLRSRLPVYLATNNHAMVLVGRATRTDGDPRYFVHDDQIGPYLAADALDSLSLADLKYQSGGFTNHNEDDLEDTPPIDMVRSDTFEQFVNTSSDGDRRVHSIILPAPTRALLPAWAAAQHALRTVALVEGRALEAAGGDRDTFAAQLTSTSVQSITMGIDYKADRLAKLDNYADSGSDVAAGKRLFGALNLSEWVVVVEGLSSSGDVVWEGVYDASSNNREPRLQFFRYGGKTIVRHGRDPRRVEHATISTVSFDPLTVPERIGKVRDDVRHTTEPGPAIHG